MFAKSSFTLALAALVSHLVEAKTSVSDDQMNGWLADGGLDLADAYAPIYFFAQAESQPPCIPTWTFGGSPDQPDDYTNDDAKTKPAGRCTWPDAGCNCKTPDKGPENPTQPFPVYYTYQKCNDNEVRVAYNLFYEKDGFAGAKVGHDYDWERVVVIHIKAEDGTWSPSTLKLSAHAGYDNIAWDDIQNTLSTDEVKAGTPTEPNGIQNEDHAKVYVAWSKHAMFNTRRTGFPTVGSQLGDDAFRGQDWWYSVPKEYYIRADDSTDAGKKLESTGWGDATSNPVSVHKGLCSA